MKCINCGNKTNNGRIVCPSCSGVDNYIVFLTPLTVPIVAVDYVFIIPDYREDAEKWLKEEREKIITKKEVEKI